MCKGVHEHVCHSIFARDAVLSFECRDPRREVPAKQEKSASRCGRVKGRTESTHGRRKKFRLKAVVPNPRPPLLTKLGAS